LIAPLGAGVEGVEEVGELDFGVWSCHAGPASWRPIFSSS
jgi:hypothetical protein